MRIVRLIPTLLIVVYACISVGYAQITDCEPEGFQCHNGQCIASELLCDGKADCQDSSDETATECKKPEILCPTLAFRCNYGACINGDNVCNGIQDCVDNSDETHPRCTRNVTNNRMERPTTNECTADQFSCNNKQCISSTDVCDGAPHCADGSDELAELCESLPCSPTAFRCSYGACIDGDLKCNGRVNCADSSDEDSRLCGNIWQTLPRLTTQTIRTTSSRPTPPTRTPRPSPTTWTPSPISSSTCRAPPQPQNGRWTLDRLQCPNGQCNVLEGAELGLGSHLVYSCNSGYEIRGSIDVICSIGGKWLTIPVCIEIRCQALTTASVRASCTYDDEWVSCESPVRPRTRAALECQNSYQPETYRLFGQRRDVRCNANGQWEPEPMRCVPVCGTIPPNIKPTVVGGFRPNITEFPWHATLYVDLPGEPKKFFCGASIIQANLLITAAHCVYDERTGALNDASSVHVLTGNIFRDYNSDFHNHLVKRNQVKHIYIARNYLGLTGNYLWDIAILELVAPFVLSTWLVPICIDTFNDRGVLEPGSYGKVAGFGRTAQSESSMILQALIVPVIPLSQCKAASQHAGTEQYITNDKFCAGYTNGSSVCDGDSGGGLVFKTNSLWYLRGIVSVSLGTKQEGGISYCDYDLYSLYTDISRHIAWIQDVITKIDQNQIHILCSDESQTRCSQI